MAQISNYINTKNIIVFHLVLVCASIIILIFTEIELWAFAGIMIVVLIISAIIIKNRKKERKRKKDIVIKIATITVFAMIGAAIVNYFKKK